MTRPGGSRHVDVAAPRLMRPVPAAPGRAVRGRAGRSSPAPALPQGHSEGALDGLDLGAELVTNPGRIGRVDDRTVVAERLVEDLLDERGSLDRPDQPGAVTVRTQSAPRRASRAMGTNRAALAGSLASRSSGAEQLLVDAQPRGHPVEIALRGRPAGRRKARRALSREKCSR